MEYDWEEENERVGPEEGGKGGEEGLIVITIFSRQDDVFPDYVL